MILLIAFPVVMSVIGYRLFVTYPGTTPADPE